MTPEELDRIEALAEQATAGPWAIGGWCQGCGNPEHKERWHTWTSECSPGSVAGFTFGHNNEAWNEKFGPMAWKWCTNSGCYNHGAITHNNGKTIVGGNDDATTEIEDADAAFIVAARNALPALLDEIDRLRRGVLECAGCGGEMEVHCERCDGDDPSERYVPGVFGEEVIASGTVLGRGDGRWPPVGADPADVERAMEDLGMPEWSRARIRAGERVRIEVTPGPPSGPFTFAGPKGDAFDGEETP